MTPEIRYFIKGREHPIATGGLIAVAIHDLGQNPDLETVVQLPSGQLVTVSGGRFSVIENPLESFRYGAGADLLKRLIDVGELPEEYSSLNRKTTNFIMSENHYKILYPGIFKDFSDEEQDRVSHTIAMISGKSREGLEEDDVTLEVNARGRMRGNIGGILIATSPTQRNDLLGVNLTLANGAFRYALTFRRVHNEDPLVLPE